MWYVLFKGIVSRDYWPPFFHQTDPPGTLIHGLKSSCWIFFFSWSHLSFRFFYRYGRQRKRFFSVVGYNGRVFFRCGIQRRRFSSIVGYNIRRFFFCGIQRRTISGWPQKIFLLYPTTQEIFLPLYPTPQQNLMQCTVSQKNLPHCIPQRRRFSSVVSLNGKKRKRIFFILGYNGRSLPPLWDTTEEVFSIVGYNWRGFFRCGIQWEKNIQHRIIFLNFKCLSLPSNKNLGKISYLNSQTNP